MRRVRQLGLGALALVAGLLVSLALATRMVRHRRSARLSAPPPSRLPYRADFGVWWQGTNAQQHAFTDPVNDAYIWTPLDPLRVAWAIFGDAPPVEMPCVAEVSATLATGPGETSYGLMLGGEVGYRALVRADGILSVDHIAGGEATNLIWEESPAIRRGQDENHLRLALGEGALTVAVNGATLATVALPEPPRGPVQLTVSVSPEVPPGSTTIYFREFTIKPAREGGADAPIATG